MEEYPASCPFCGELPHQSIVDPGAPYPGGYFIIEYLNDNCPASEVTVSEKCRTDIPGMSHSEAEAMIWPRIITRWNTRAIFRNEL